MSMIIFADEGWADYVYWQGEDRKTLKKINRLLQSISRDGALAGEGKPEKLKYRKVNTAAGLTKKTAWFMRFQRIKLQ